MPQAEVHYDAEYFRWQEPIGALGGALNRWRFEAHCGSDKVVCDFGCGGGFLLANLPARERIGIEVNPVARAQAAARGLRVVDSPAGIPPASVDVIVSNHALEHVEAPLEALRALRALLRPGGRFVLCVPINDWRDERAYVAGDVNHHLYTWTPLLLGNLVHDAGFVVEEARVIRDAWSPRLHRMFGWSSRALRWAAAMNAGLRRRRSILLAARVDVAAA